MQKPSKKKPATYLKESFKLNSEIKLNKSQKEFYQKIQNNLITFGTGPAGTAKTWTACYAALEMLKNNEVDKIVLTRPIVESGENLGFLPGDVNEKILPYAMAFFDNIQNIIGEFDFKLLLDSEKITFQPIAYLRGRNLNNSVILLDEAQNCDIRQLMLVITRLGKKSKMIITGDISQYDIKEDSAGLQFCVNMIKDIANVDEHVFQRSDIVRNPILVEITDRYDKLKAEGKLPKNKK